MLRALVQGRYFGDLENLLPQSLGLMSELQEDGIARKAEIVLKIIRHQESDTETLFFMWYNRLHYGSNFHPSLNLPPLLYDCSSPH